MDPYVLFRSWEGHVGFYADYCREAVPGLQGSPGGHGRYVVFKSSEFDFFSLTSTKAFRALPPRTAEN